MGGNVGTPDGFEGSPSLRAERSRAGMSQDELAARSGVSVRTIRMLELGGRRPRSSTVTRVLVALGASGTVRSQVRREVGLTAAPRAVDPTEMVSEAPYAAAIAAVRTQLDGHATVSVVRDAHLRGRSIVRERMEKVLVATDNALTEIPVVLVADEVPAAAHARAEAVAGCHVTEVTRLPDSTMTIVRLELDRPVRAGRGCTVVYDEFYAAPIVRPVSGETWIGTHTGLDVAVVRVHFDAPHLPRSCVEVFESRLGGAKEYGAPVHVSAGGVAEVVLLDPDAGWHGITWTW